MDLNKAMLIGNLTRDPELRTTPNGTSVCTFGVATNRAYTDASGVKKDQVEFHNIVAWGKLAEICSQFLGKGRKVFIEGRLQTRDWEAQDGAKKTRTEIIAENMIMLDKTGGAGGAGQASAAGAKNYGKQNMSAAPAEAAPIEEIQVEDIPF